MKQSCWDSAHLSLMYRPNPRAVIFTTASRMNTEVKRKLKIWRAKCSSWTR